MKRVKQNGFVLVLVIATMALTGAVMFILTGSSNTILFQTDNAFIEACERNLTASGLSWAEYNIRNESIESFGNTIELVLTDFDIKKTTLSVTVSKPENNQAEVQISTSCSRGRQTLRHRQKYQIGL